MRWGALIQVDRLCGRHLLWDTTAQAEPRSKAIEIRFVVTAADLSDDSELQPAKLDDRVGILLTLPRLAAPGFHGNLGVVQVGVTPKTKNPFTIKALSISGVTWKWHVLNHAETQSKGEIVVERLNRIQTLDGVLAANLVFHHVEPARGRS